MFRTVLTSGLAGLLLATALIGQHEDHHAGHHSEYASQESSGIAALSARELDDLLAGAGMGWARAAELNRYPGPKHVLELESELRLQTSQRIAVEVVRVAMLEEARELGRQIVEAERVMNRRFSHQHIDEESLAALVGEIADLYGALRLSHLKAHLKTRELLSDDQVREYDRLRGYADASD